MLTIGESTGEACGCGCEAPEPKTRDEEIAELSALREAVLRRLSELTAVEHAGA
ncbi:MAG: hypothetical protein ACRDJ4_06715 [Actinomycetota bacterium]